MTSLSIKEAAEIIRGGGLVAFPTETVYGLGANALDPAAVQKIFEMKGRPETSPLIVHVASVEMAREIVAEWPPLAEELARQWWPGPLTMIVPAASHLPLKVTANTGNVALRVPASEIPLAVVRAAKIPITATSANLSGAAECTTADQVQEQLQGRISLIVDGGRSPRTVSSTIVHFKEDGTWQILREGAIPAKDIVEALS